MELNKITDDIKLNITEKLINEMDNKSILNLQMLQDQEITDENYKLAKDTRSENNKLKQEIKNKETKIKQIVSNAFKLNTKEYFNAQTKLDQNIKAYEQILRDEKSELIQKKYNIPSSEVKPQWLNKTTTFDKIEKDIEDERLERIIEETQEKEDSKYIVKLTFNNVSKADLNKFIMFCERNGGDLDLKEIK